MPIDIYRLDNLDEETEDPEDALGKYADDLVADFLASPEGQAHLAAHPEAGFWVYSLIEMAYQYIGVTLPEMRPADVQEIVTELWPAKVSLLAPEDADDAMPEMAAFWKCLKRQYGLPAADQVLRFLDRIAPRFKRLMNDPSRFGMAKSFFMAGQAAGFDMTKEEDIEAFMAFFNASMAGDQGLVQGLGPPPPLEPTPRDHPDPKKKKLKAARAARRRNRPKKK